MLFSIVTVAFNNLEGLRRTGVSVAEQTCRDHEWIVIDGGSADGTKDYLEKSAARWVSEPDKGIYDAMNKGLAMAQGDYMIFMNAGDEFAAADVLSVAAAAIKENNHAPDFVYGDAREGGFYKQARSYQRSRLGMFTHHQAMFYRRMAASGLCYDERYKIAADYKFTRQVLARSDVVLYLPQAICIFEQGGVSQTQAVQGRNEQFRIRLEEGGWSALASGPVYLAQAFLWNFRHLHPRLYWRLKRGIAPSAGQVYDEPTLKNKGGHNG